MKTLRHSFFAFLILAWAATASAATMGFAGTLEVESVKTSDTKAVFIVSGPCELLLRKPADATGSTQDVVSALDHAAIVLYRTQQEFSDESWREARERFQQLSGKRAYFHTASPRYTWEGSDLVAIVTAQILVELAADGRVSQPGPIAPAVMAAQATAADYDLPDAHGASGRTPVIQLDGTATREAMNNGTRIMLLGAGYETVFTGDSDLGKATARRLRIAYLVELHSKDPKDICMAVRDLQVFADGVKTPLHGKAESAIMTPLGTYRRADARGSRYAVPEKVADPSAQVVEQSLRFAPPEPEPELLNILIDVQNGEGLGGTCWLKGVRMK